MLQIEAKSAHILSTQVTNSSWHPSCIFLSPKFLLMWPVFKAMKVKYTHRLSLKYLAYEIKRIEGAYFRLIDEVWGDNKKTQARYQLLESLNKAL